MTDNDYVKDPVASPARYAASGVAPGSGTLTEAGYACPFAVWNVSTAYTPNNALIVDPYWQEYKLWKDQGCVPATHRTGINPKVWSLNNMYRIFGSYNVSKESLSMLNGTIDQIGNAVRQLGLFSNPCLINVVGFPATDTGIYEYNISRHQY